MLDYVPAVVPLVGDVLSTILQMTTFGVLCFCLSKFLRRLADLWANDCIARRTQWVRTWSKLPFAQWCEYSKGTALEDTC